MKRLLLGFLAVVLIVTVAKLDRRRVRGRRPPSARRQIEGWEGEGGAVPVDNERTAAQTTAAI